MALYPPAIKKLITPGKNDPRVDVMIGTVAHVAVSLSDSLHDYFDGPSGGVESHFYIRLDGTVEQYRDTAYEADAQVAGNSWVVGATRYGFVSIESEGMGSGTWTDAQVASLKDLITWVNNTHGSPWVKTPGFRSPGHGYHCLFSEWNPNNHSCPGPDRVKQYETTIVPWLATGGQQQEPDDMTLAELIDALNHAASRDTPAGRQLGDGLSKAAGVNQARADIAALSAKVDAISVPQPTIDYDALAKALIAEVSANHTIQTNILGKA